MHWRLCKMHNEFSVICVGWLLGVENAYTWSLNWKNWQQNMTQSTFSKIIVYLNNLVWLYINFKPTIELWVAMVCFKLSLMVVMIHSLWVETWLTFFLPANAWTGSNFIAWMWITYHKPSWSVERYPYVKISNFNSTNLVGFDVANDSNCLHCLANVVVC